MDMLTTHAAAENIATKSAALDALLERAVNGEAVTNEEYRAAHAEVRESRTDAELAGAISVHRKKVLERESIERLAATAAEMDRLGDKKAAAVVEAARAFDLAHAAARDAQVAWWAASAALAEHDRDAHAYNVSTLETEASGNATLAAMHKSVWPKAKTASQVPLSFHTPTRLEMVEARNVAGIGLQDVVVRGTGEEIAKSSLGRLHSVALAV